jgi:ferric-dicitrate binding protein FerR (iron transport regulator)
MSRFDQLLEGYLQNSLTDSELEEFFALVQENPDLDLVRRRQFDERQAGLTDRAQRERMLVNIWARAKEAERARMERLDGMAERAGMEMAEDEAGHAGMMLPEDEAERAGIIKPGVRAERKTVPLWRWVAAAAVLILLGTTGILLLPREKKMPVAVQTVHYTNDVAPGKTGAVLQLADGSTITLDSAGKGVIARQGDATVVRQGNGGVAYRAAGDGHDAAILYNKLSTGKGRQFQVVLPDGTKVWLNSSSSLRYPTTFSGGQRRVEMTGEAYFEVTPDAARPFIVKADRQDITVLGTNFNVNVYDDEPVKRTTLLQGSIRVNTAQGHALLVPGEEATTDRNGSQLKVNTVNAEDAVAWKNGFFHFDNADLPTVMRQLARWYDVEVRYEGAVPASGDFKGEIGRDLTLAQVLKVLEQARVHFRIEEDKRIVIFP